MRLFLLSVYLFLCVSCAGGSSGDPCGENCSGPGSTDPADPTQLTDPSNPNPQDPLTGVDGMEPVVPVPPPQDLSFVHAEGQRLVGLDDEDLKLRGVNLGNWLLVEGYMWRLFPSHGHGVRHREIEQRVDEMVGTAWAAQFWQDYRERYITAADLERIKELGLNSVRLPLNARFLLPEDSTEFREEGFADIDRLIDAAREAGVLVFLDMHAAPGGQSGKDIDDSPRFCPDLFVDPAHQDRLVALWGEIARRYANEPVIAGYDLLNEPLPFLDQVTLECRPSADDYWGVYIPQLWPLYQRIGAAIRQVDPNHLMIVEGAHWGSDVDFSVGPPFDENMMYSFHFYGTPAHQNEVQEYVDARERFDRPIWVGEFGEDHHHHIESLVDLFEANDFGWAYWTWKRMDSDKPFQSVAVPDDWDAVGSYLAGEGGRPDTATGRRALGQFLDNMRIADSSENQPTISALLE